MTLKLSLTFSSWIFKKSIPFLQIAIKWSPWMSFMMIRMLDFIAGFHELESKSHDNDKDVLKFITETFRFRQQLHHCHMWCVIYGMTRNTLKLFNCRHMNTRFSFLDFVQEEASSIDKTEALGKKKLKKCMLWRR